MSLDIGRALREGGRRLAAPDGLQVLGALLLVGLANTVAVQSLAQAYAAAAREAGVELPSSFPPPTPLALDVGLGTVFAALLVLALVAEAVRIVAVRAMVREETTAIPASLATRNLPLATLNGFVGGIVVLVLSALAAVALVVPGLYLAAALYFVRQEIAVEDRNFVEAVERSWVLTRGDRLEVFVVAAVIVGANLAVAGVPSRILLALLGPGSVVPPLASAALAAVAGTFGIAVASRAYVQLTDARERDAEDGPDAADDGDDGEEWPDPPGVDI